jgi:hypothetical protein
MFTTLRIYSGMPGVAPRFLAKKDEIEKVMRGVPGFAGYRLVATPDGIAAVTICETQEGCEASAKAASAWIQQNMPDLAPKAPQIISGESLISFGAKPSR